MRAGGGLDVTARRRLFFCGDAGCTGECLSRTRACWKDSLVSGVSEREFQGGTESCGINIDLHQTSIELLTKPSIFVCEIASNHSTFANNGF